MKLLQDVLRETAWRYPEKAAFENLGQDLSFSQLVRGIESLAGALANLGIRKGDRLTILAENSVEYIYYHYAMGMLGAILHVINTRLSEREMTWMVNNAESSVLVLDESHALRWLVFSKDCPSIQFLIGIGEVEGAKYGTNELISAAYTLKGFSSVSPEDPALLIYTSGTTGMPKGALQTHEGSTLQDELMAEALLSSPDDVYLAFMPYFHQAGLIRTRSTLMRGGKNVTMGKKLDIFKVANIIAEKRISLAFVPPPVDSIILETMEREKLDLSCLRLIVGAGGAGPAHAAKMKQFCEKLHCRFMGVYGLTECTGTVTYVMDPEAFTNPNTCGKPFRGLQVEIWDDDHRPLPTGKVGEVMVRGQTNVPGYWKNDQATRELFTGEWLHTGDLGRLDEEGFLYIVDRKKDMIKTGAENVYSKEVEDVLGTHPSIADLAVIGLKDPNPAGWGEIVTAIIVPKPEAAQLTVDEIKAFCKDKIAGYKMPKIVHNVEVIPRNAIGKVQKVDLRKQFSLETVGKWALEKADE
jgi:fatty-acyl-CoA synthase